MVGAGALWAAQEVCGLGIGYDYRTSSGTDAPTSRSSVAKCSTIPSGSAPQRTISGIRINRRSNPPGTAQCGSAPSRRCPQPRSTRQSRLRKKLFPWNLLKGVTGLFEIRRQTPGLAPTSACAAEDRTGNSRIVPPNLPTSPTRPGEHPGVAIWP